MAFKADSIHNQKQIDNSKMLIEQKRMLLERLEQENAISTKKTETCKQAIKSAKVELEKIKKLTEESVEMQAKESQREEYYTIKSQV
jgi:multidrug resistance efflux pump